MRRSRRPIVIASRKSPLARAQAQAVARAITQANGWGEDMVRFLWIESEGDQKPDEALARSGGKGLFTRAIERAVLSRDADLAVHSMKDLPAAEATPSLTIAAVPMREDVRDCLVGQRGETTLESLPRGAVLGTASPRRAAQALRVRPDLRITLMRGNVETRVRKVKEDKLYDATLMAVAGLSRAGLASHASAAIDPSVVLPAACQGALGLQCRQDDHITLTRCLALNHAATAASVHAERTIVASLGGDCDSAIAVLCEPTPAGFRLRARVLSGDGRDCIDVDTQATAKGLQRTIKEISADLKTRGAERLLRK